MAKKQKTKPQNLKPYNQHLSYRENITEELVISKLYQEITWKLEG